MATRVAVVAVAVWCLWVGCQLHYKLSKLSTSTVLVLVVTRDREATNTTHKATERRYWERVEYFFAGMYESINLLVCQKNSTVHVGQTDLLLLGLVARCWMLVCVCYCDECTKEPFVRLEFETRRCKSQSSPCSAVVAAAAC